MHCDNIITTQKSKVDFYLLTRGIDPTSCDIFRRELIKEFKYNLDLFYHDLLDINDEFMNEYGRFIETDKKDSRYYAVKAKYDILYKLVENYLEGTERYAGYLLSDHVLELYGDLMKYIRNGPYDARDKYCKMHKDDPEFQKLNSKAKEHNMFKGVDIKSSSGGKKSAYSNGYVGVIWGYKL